MTLDAKGNELSEQNKDRALQALGLKPDPVKLAADLQAAQRQADAHRAGERQARTGERQARVELAVLRAAPELGADSEALLDSRSFLSAVSALDPGAPDFADQVKTAITDAAAANPAYQRRPQRKPDSGNTGTSSGQWTLDQVRAAKPAEVDAALKAGLLRDLGYGIAKPGRGQ